MKNRMPMKWKKHLVLVEFGIRTKENLESEIYRYSSNSFTDLMNELKNRFQRDEQKQEKKLYTVSFVPINDYYQLPNITFETKEDLEIIKQKIDNTISNNFSEIWLLEKNLNVQNSMFIGRFSINDTYCSDEQWIEQIWSSNHRNIESWNKNLKIEYLKARRAGWAKRYHVEDIQIFDEGRKNEIIKQFIETAKQIEQNREKLEIFMKYLKSLGIHEVCLEYMSTNHGIQFIDWDSPNDKKVIENLFRETREEDIER